MLQHFLRYLSTVGEHWVILQTYHVQQCADGAAPGWCCFVPPADPIYLLDNRALQPYTAFRIPTFGNVAQGLPVIFCFKLLRFWRLSRGVLVILDVNVLYQQKRKGQWICLSLSATEESGNRPVPHNDTQRRMLFLPFCICRIALAFGGGS